jgi:MFS family permease
MSAAASPRVKRMQRTSVTLLLIGCALNYIDRTALSVANPLIRHDLGLSIAEMGLLLSAFLWAYAAAQLPTGAMVDRYGPRVVIGGAVVLWSIAQGVAGLVNGFWQFVVARIFLGVGEGPQFSGLIRVVRDWFNVRERGLPTGTAMSGSKVGPAIAPPLLTALMLAFGWRWMFVILGVGGVVLGIVWYALYREVGEAGLTEAERASLVDGEPPQVADRVSFEDWRRLFGYRATWGMVLGFFGEVYMTWVYLSWLPGYLEIERHMSIPTTGLVAAIPFGAGIIGSIGNGWVMDRLIRRGFSPINSCKIPLVSALIGVAVFTTIGALTADNFLAISAITVALLFNGGCGPMAWALSSVAAPRHCTASLGSIQNCGGYIGGALAPTITGFVVQGTGSFVPALLVSAAMGVAASLLYVFMVPGKPIEVAAFATARVRLAVE